MNHPIIPGTLSVSDAQLLRAQKVRPYVPLPSAAGIRRPPLNPPDADPDRWLTADKVWRVCELNDSPEQRRGVYPAVTPIGKTI